jgi:hypothetical protein
MTTTVGTVTVTEIAESFGLDECDLYREALTSFLRDKKRQVLQLKLEILGRYGAESLEDLESRIAKGAVVEHPAWEDLIVAENLTARLEELDAHLADLQGAESNRSS